MEKGEIGFHSEGNQAGLIRSVTIGLLMLLSSINCLESVGSEIQCYSLRNSCK